MPSVMVVEDFRGSMASQIDMGTSRVEALGDVLFEPAGVIASNADLRFGLALVSATGDMLCPDIVTVGIGSELEENAPAFIKTVSPACRGTNGAMGFDLCSDEKNKQWTAWVESNAEAIGSGYEGQLAKARESTARCAALYRARTGELEAAF